MFLCVPNLLFDHDIWDRTSTIIYHKLVESDMINGRWSIFWDPGFCAHPFIFLLGFRKHDLRHNWPYRKFSLHYDSLPLVSRRHLSYVVIDKLGRKGLIISFIYFLGSQIYWKMADHKRLTVCDECIQFRSITHFLYILLAYQKLTTAPCETFKTLCHNHLFRKSHRRV